MRADVQVRFWSKVTLAGPDECWPWLSTHNHKGYGQFMVDGKVKMAHRLAYEDRIGPIPPGLTLDHLCRNRACCNPAHLEPVSNRENILRGNGATARNARKTHCKNGHEFTPDNIYRSSTGRECRTCRRAADFRRPGRYHNIPPQPPAQPEER